MNNYKRERKVFHRGFTIVELMVSMAITILIVTMIVSITGIALDAWRSGRNEVRASRQAKALLDVVGKDLESMVIRSGNNYEWFRAEDETDDIKGDGVRSPNASRIIFFTAATDRYDGDLEDADSKGDVSTVVYNLNYGDPIGGGQTKEFNTFAFYRQLVNPDKTFEDLLAKENLDDAYKATTYADEANESEHFICENIYEMSVIFLIEYQKDGVTKQVRVPVIKTGSDAVDYFSIKGGGMFVDKDDASGTEDYTNGRLLSVDISITVLSDHGLTVLKAAGDKLAEREEFLLANSYRYSRTVLLPQP